MSKENDWQQITKHFMVNCHRGGWLGVYDALKSAITKRDRFIVAKPAALGLYMKKTKDGCYYSDIKFELLYEDK